MRRLIAFLFVIPSIFLGTGLIVQEVSFRGPLKNKLDEYRSTMERHLPTFLEDQQALSEIETFKIDIHGKDAGPFLNPLVRWGAGTQEGARYLAGIEKSPISVPPTISAQLAADPKAWLDLSEKFDFGSFDLSWMAQARTFEYWDIFGAPPVREMFEMAKAGQMHMLNYQTELPLPELKDVLVFAKIRLMKGIKEKNLVPALSEVRHLAKLCYSTEALYGELIAVALLGVERVAFDYAVAHQMLKKGDWKAIPPELHQRIKRTLFGAWGYFSPISTTELVEQTYGSGKVAVGKCAGIREGTTWIAAIDRHLFSQFPLERDFRGVLGSLRSVATDPNNGCRQNDIRAYWTDPFSFRAWGVDANAAFSSLGKDGDKFWIAAEMMSYRLPYYRKASGLALAIIGIPSAFKAYEQSDSQVRK